MQTASTFLCWNACGEEGVWMIDEGHDYPRLWWEDPSGIPIAGQLSDLLMGAGTEDDPYQIHTAAQFNLIGRFPCEWGRHFKLMADIDLAVCGTSGSNIIGRYVCGKVDAFAGVFDGNGHTIANFTYHGSGSSNIGLFGYASGQIEALGLIDPRIDAEAGASVGALVGSCHGGVIAGCYVKGGNISGKQNIGGLVGENCGEITNCYSDCEVFGQENVGGLVGQNGDERRIAGGRPTKYTTIPVPGEIRNCYSMGLVAGQLGTGGLAGQLVAGTVAGSFWDIETSGQVESAGGTGKSTAEMQAASTFVGAGWDFVHETRYGTDDIWWIHEGQDYPRLWWEW
jgi:hypothetical protein